jgi:predicted DsbA family dithiol-disulfide isomerase
MAVPPKFTLSHILSSPPTAGVHTLELYLDYVCPFSAKLFSTVYTHILPLTSSTYPQARFIFRHQIQPWHPSSTLVHEAALAVARVSPEKFLPFSKLLMEGQAQFFDDATVEESRSATYARLAKLAGEVGVDEEEVKALLRLGEGNEGNQITGDLKRVVREARTRGIHVSPTVVFDGIVENAISSGCTKEQWLEWLDKNVK